VTLACGMPAPLEAARVARAPSGWLSEQPEQLAAAPFVPPDVAVNRFVTSRERLRVAEDR
jgi:hypothetical protein